MKNACVGLSQTQSIDYASKLAEISGKVLEREGRER